MTLNGTVINLISLLNSWGGWNKREGAAKVSELINVEGGIFRNLIQKSLAYFQKHRFTNQVTIQWRVRWFHIFYVVVQKKLIVLLHSTKIIFKSYLPKIMTQIRFQVKTKWLYILRKIFKFGDDITMLIIDI